MGKVLDKVMEYHHKYTGGIAWRVKKHALVLDNYINPDEEVIYAFCAQKNEKFSEIFNTYAIAITNKRILLGKKRLLWGSFLSTVTPDMYNDMQIYRGLIWGKITIDTVKELLVFTNISVNALDEIETTISEFMMEAKKKYKNDKEEY